MEEGIMSLEGSSIRLLHFSRLINRIMTDTAFLTLMPRLEIFLHYHVSKAFAMLPLIPPTAFRRNILRVSYSILHANPCTIMIQNRDATDSLRYTHANDLR